MPESPAVLVVGCGYVGRALVGMLAAAGRRVVAVRRSVVRDATDGVTWRAADATDPAALRSALADVGAVEALVYLTGPRERSDAAYRAAYVDGLATSMQVLAGRPEASALTRLVFASSTAVYGQADGSWVDEDAPTDPPSFSGARLLEGEAQAARFEGRSTSMRFGGIYGPGRTRLIDRVAAGHAIAAPDVPRYVSRMEQRDCAGAVAHVLTLPDPAPRYVAVDEEPADMRDVQAFLCAELGVDPKALAPFEAGPRARGLGKRGDSGRLRASGYAFAVPSYREGYGALLASRGR